MLGCHYKHICIVEINYINIKVFYFLQKYNASRFFLTFCSTENVINKKIRLYL